MRRLLACVSLSLAACAAGYGAPGPGASRITRVHGPSVYTDPFCYGWCKVYLDPGFIHKDGPGLKFMFGAKLGASHGAFAGRERALGIGSEPHIDLTWVPKSDRWAVTATVGWVFQTLFYEHDVVQYSGVAPSASFHYGLRRRLYVHAGLGRHLGTLEVAPEAASDGMTASAGVSRVLGGMTFVFRRTPSIDFALRVEASAYASDEVTIGPERGRFTGWGLTFEGLLSSF
jgi:hypothetical protein